MYPFVLGLFIICAFACGSCTAKSYGVLYLGPPTRARPVQGARLPTMTLLDRRVLACWQWRVVGGLRGPRGTRKSGTGIGGSVRPRAGWAARPGLVLST